MDKASAEEVRLKASEKLSATNKGNNTEEGLSSPRKHDEEAGNTIAAIG